MPVQVALHTGQRQTSMESIRSLALDRGEVINEGSRSKGNLSSLPMYDASIISAATYNFSPSQKLGEGGFGTVFKAWTLWKDGKALELLDTSILENSNHHREEIMRCIQIGLLCVQDRPDDRPHMSAAVLMLNSRDAVVPQPKQPAYFSDRVTSDIESSSCCTVYDTTLTIVEPR
ncbi:Cysteine-rich receptor-like protein kinase 10 [Carex littledalei]|uniref:Cysteine-rich receptor-like protein kinase 10 n=1 Tax=Carex littledalei TaxID=544730 RepID=A0A833QCU6_9POAL|nr:Cysteine-rich receptor-like protein kinase 10 [Carex littledalei]